MLTKLGLRSFNKRIFRKQAEPGMKFFFSDLFFFTSIFFFWIFMLRCWYHMLSRLSTTIYYTSGFQFKTIDISQPFGHINFLLYRCKCVNLAESSLKNLNDTFLLIRTRLKLDDDMLRFRTKLVEETRIRTKFSTDLHFWVETTSTHLFKCSNIII